MSDQRHLFGDTSIAVVTFAERDRLRGHRDWMLTQMGPQREQVQREPSLASEIAFLSDPDRSAYNALGLSRASLHRLYNPGTIRLYARLLRQGRRIRRPTEDTRQLGGDAVLAADGSVHSVFRPSSPDARPSIEALTLAVDAARR